MDSSFNERQSEDACQMNYRDGYIRQERSQSPQENTVNDDSINIQVD
jgi:hypothetical protein